MPARASGANRLTARIGQAAALGAIHGPAELLPISSSGHIALLPWLLGWDEREQDDELQKSFEVALHAGTAAALLVALRGEVAEAVRGLDGPAAALLALSSAPAALAGLTLEHAIERHLGTPATIAAGLAAGAIVIAWADRSPQARRRDQAGAADALWLGVAQACALFPGVSRNGATLAAARFRQFTRADSSRLSRHVALPVIAGATSLKGLRLARRGLAPGTALPLAVGAGAAFASTLASTWVIKAVERNRPLLPFTLYRLGLAAVVLARLRRASTARRSRAARS
jgi:undecaprenyl-diphosphatase